MRFTRRQKKLILTIVITAAAVIFCAFMVIGIVKINHKNAELNERLVRLQELIAQEEQRRTDLENDEVYVKTKEYIEEKAKSIGYVYPDEIIFKEDE